MADHDLEPSETDRPIVGQVVSSMTSEPCGGFQVVVEVEGDERNGRIGAGVSQLDGVFAIPLTPDEADRVASDSRRFVLVVSNRFGRVVHRQQGLDGRSLLRPIEIGLVYRERDDHPIPAYRPDPLRGVPGHVRGRSERLTACRHRPP